MTPHQPPNGTLVKSQRRWYQFRLRTLFVVMVVACIGGGWLGRKVHHGLKQRRAVLAFQEMGAEFIYLDYHTYSPLDSLVDRLLGDEILADCGAVLLGDNQLVNDANLATIREITALNHLDLSWTAITDAGLEHLKGLTELGTLKLEGTRVTDVGLGHLKELTQLEELDLSGTQITDAGLEELTGLAQLNKLHIKGTRVTKDGARRLQMTCPRLFISPG
jgi:hypothetical protein